jgi:hypothetical protein
MTRPGHPWTSAAQTGGGRRDWGREGKKNSLKDQNHTQYLYILNVLKIYCTEKPFVKATFLKLKTRSMCQPPVSHIHLSLSAASTPLFHKPALGKSDPHYSILVIWSSGTIPLPISPVYLRAILCSLLLSKPVMAGDTGRDCSKFCYPTIQLSIMLNTTLPWSP